MNFGRWDMSIIIVMSIAVISMTFVFPALGLTGSEATTDDIPEFNSTASQYEYRDEFPNNPGAPSEGILIWYEKEPELSTQQAIFLDGDTTDGIEISVVNSNNKSDPVMQVFINNWTDGAGVGEDNVKLQEVGDTGNVSHGDFIVHVEWTRVRNTGSENLTAEVKFTVAQQPSDVSFFGRMPLVGDILSAGEELAAILGWIGSILYWIMATIVSIIWQTFATVIDILVFGFGIAHWLTTAYGNVVDGASAWASVFLLIPGIILSLELLKVALIGVDLLWIG